MVKLSGGSRTLTNGSREYNRRMTEYQMMIQSGKYDPAQSYFSQKGGGYVLVEKSSQEHLPEEKEAARFMADKGYKIELKDEGGQATTPDGKVFSASFEQRTPDGKDGHNTPQNIRAALRHARNKNADVAVIYQKNGRHSKKTVMDGIKLFEQSANYRFKRIYIVTRDGRIHRHAHNN